MFAVFLTPAYAPFTIAFVVMLGIGVIEAIGLGLGELDLDVDLDGHPDGIGGALLDWLGLGSGVPILIWLTALLACFTLAGIAVQQVATAVTGAPFHAAIAVAIALPLGLLANMAAVRGLVRIMPGFESSAISQGDLLRLRGTILEGVASRGHPARAKVIDQHGQAHYIMVEPHHESDLLAQGESALVVRRDGAVFFVLPDAATALRPVS